MAIDYKKIADEAAALEDHNETSSGNDYEYSVPPVGPTMARFIEYIELGNQPQRPYQGQPKPDAPCARFTFELLSKKNLKEVDSNGKKVTIADRISFELPISLSGKSKFKKLYEALRYGRDGISHFSQMLNEAYIVTVLHNEVEKDGKKRTYVNIRDENGWKIQPPVFVDPETEVTKKVPVPNAISEIKVFIWNRPCKESWASLHIAGTKTVKDEKGKEQEVSKNWLQEKIQSASNFQGSPLEDLLVGADEIAELAEPKEEPKAKKPEAKAPAEKKKAPAKAKATASAPAEDPLAALGLY